MEIASVDNDNLHQSISVKDTDAHEFSCAFSPISSSNVSADVLKRSAFYFRGIFYSALTLIFLVCYV
jgi:hypothetical protein